MPRALNRAGPIGQSVDQSVCVSTPGTSAATIFCAYLPLTNTNSGGHPLGSRLACRAFQTIRDKAPDVDTAATPSRVSELAG